MSRRTRALRDEIADINWQLNDESERALNTMMEYLRLKNVAAYPRLSVQRDLTQMALEAQGQGRTLDDMIDGDHQAFCDAIIAELPQPGVRERRLRMLRDGVGGLALFWFIAFPMLLILQYLTYSSLPIPWDVLEELGYVSTDVLVMPAHFVLLAIGVVAMARRSVSKKTMQANMQFRPWRKALYYIVFFGVIVMINALGRQGALPMPGFLVNEIATMPLSVNLIIQMVLIGVFLVINEFVD